MPRSFLSCGITHRDHRTLSQAAALCQQPIRIICSGLPVGLNWPSNVELVDGGPGWNFEKSVVSYEDLLYDYYAQCAASVICLNHDPIEYHAIGFTNLIEAMAMARPIIMTRTGAVPSEIDVEKAGCGVLVPPENPEVLAEAIETLANDPQRSEAMGLKGRELAQRYYNIERYASELHRFFESL